MRDEDGDFLQRLKEYGLEEAWSRFDETTKVLMQVHEKQAGRWRRPAGQDGGAVERGGHDDE